MEHSDRGEAATLFEQGIACFEAGDYFAAHDIWEELWRYGPSDKKAFYKGLVQVAVALFHAERGNRPGAQRLYQSACQLLQPYRPVCLGRDVDRLLQEVGQWLQQRWRSADGEDPSTLVTF
ncbi:MAG: DUF309 domain-containing protein, partial [Gemmataceae bacterium]|nr:DUF309 domain-containing protein [Gemmataceae bacterium]